MGVAATKFGVQHLKGKEQQIWRSSVAAGPTINWAKRFSISDSKIIIIIIIRTDPRELDLEMYNILEQELERQNKSKRARERNSEQKARKGECENEIKSEKEHKKE